MTSINIHHIKKITYYRRYFDVVSRYVLVLEIIDDLNQQHDINLFSDEILDIKKDSMNNETTTDLKKMNLI